MDDVASVGPDAHGRCRSKVMGVTTPAVTSGYGVSMADGMGTETSVRIRIMEDDDVSFMSKKHGASKAGTALAGLSACTWG